MNLMLTMLAMPRFGTYLHKLEPSGKSRGVCCEGMHRNLCVIMLLKSYRFVFESRFPSSPGIRFRNLRRGIVKCHIKQALVDLSQSVKGTQSEPLCVVARPVVPPGSFCFWPCHECPICVHHDACLGDLAATEFWRASRPFRHIL